MKTIYQFAQAAMDFEIAKYLNLIEVSDAFRNIQEGHLSDFETALLFGLLDESSGFEQIMYRSGKQVDNADECVIVSVSSGPAFDSLEDAVERFNPGIAVA